LYKIKLCIPDTNSEASGRLLHDCVAPVVNVHEQLKTTPEKCEKVILYSCGILGTSQKEHCQNFCMEKKQKFLQKLNVENF
jgi:hypothetical protein